MTISSEVQKLETDNIVSLYMLDTTPIGGTEIFRFTKKMREDSVISFGGNEYNAIDLNVSGFIWDGRGNMPTPTMQISNVANLLTAVVIELKDLIGSTLTRIRTFEKHLDDGSDPDDSATFPLDVYTVEQKTKHNKVFIEWQLSSILDQSARMLPGRIILRDVCTHTYRVWNATTGVFDYSNASCPYSGANSFDQTDAYTSADKDNCSRRLSGCRLRFGQYGQLPTRAFPGVGKTRV